MHSVLAAGPIGAPPQSPLPVESRGTTQADDFFTFARIDSGDTALRRLEPKKAVASATHCCDERYQSIWHNSPYAHIMPSRREVDSISDSYKRSEQMQITRFFVDNKFLLLFHAVQAMSVWLSFVEHVACLLGHLRRADRALRRQRRTLQRLCSRAEMRLQCAHAR